MNNIEQHVTNLKLSKRLKELGVPQNSYLKWFSPNSIIGDDRSHFVTNDYGTGWGHEVICSAFLASELGEMLPKSLYLGDEGVKHFLCSSYYEKNNAN